MSRLIPMQIRMLCTIAIAGGGLMVASLRAEEPHAGRKPIVLSDEAAELHRSCLLIDGHNDLPWELRDRGSVDFSSFDISQRQEEIHTDIPRLREGGVGAQFWSVYVPVSYGYRGMALNATIEQIDLVKSMIRRYPNDFALALNTKDIEEIRKTGKIASLIGVEGGHCIEDSLGNLENLYRMGARYMTLTHSDSLNWADAATDDEKSGGLNEFGREVVRTMNRMGMLVDLSHVSPATMHDALDVSKAPVIFSHSSARAVCDVPRNVPDDVLKRVKELDGVVMVNFYSGFIVPAAAERYKARMELRRQLEQEFDANEVDRRVRAHIQRTPMPRGNIHDVLDHIMHMVEVAGAEHVGIGSDFDGVDALPEQLESVATYPLLTQGMLDRGLTPEQIRLILGENVMRVMRKAEAVAKEMQEEQP